MCRLASPCGRGLNESSLLIVMLLLNVSSSCVQAWVKQKQKTKHKCSKMSGSKASFREQLKRCFEKNLIREVCRVTETDDPFIIYEFLDKLTGNETFYAYAYLQGRSQEFARGTKEASGGRGSGGRAPLGDRDTC